MKTWILLILTSVVSMAAPARTTAVQTAVLKSEGLQADFVQRFTPQGFTTEQIERGTVVFGPAPKMRWNYSSPESKTFVFDGTTSWLYTPAERQVTVARLSEKEKREIPFVVISSAAELNRFFTITERTRSGAVISQIRPRNGASAIREVTVTIDRASSSIRSLAYTDRQGNRTVFEFRNYRKAAAADQAFQFVPPPGVDVVQAQR